MAGQERNKDWDASLYLISTEDFHKIKQQPEFVKAALKADAYIGVAGAGWQNIYIITLTELLKHNKVKGLNINQFKISKQEVKPKLEKIVLVDVAEHQLAHNHALIKLLSQHSVKHAQELITDNLTFQGEAYKKFLQSQNNKHSITFSQSLIEKLDRKELLKPTNEELNRAKALPSVFKDLCDEETLKQVLNNLPDIEFEKGCYYKVLNKHLQKTDFNNCLCYTSNVTQYCKHCLEKQVCFKTLHESAVNSDKTLHAIHGLGPYVVKPLHEFLKHALTYWFRER